MRTMTVKTTEYFRDVRIKLLKELWLNPTPEINAKLKLWDAIHDIDWWDQGEPRTTPLRFRKDG